MKKFDTLQKRIKQKYERIEFVWLVLPPKTKQSIKISLFSLIIFSAILSAIFNVFGPKKVQVNAATLDFSASEIREVRGINEQMVLVLSENNGYKELWFFNTQTNSKEEDSFPVSVSQDFPIAAKDGNAFWLSSDKKIVFAFNIENKTIIKKSVPAFDPTKGERAEVKFWGIPWNVIISADNFSFFSKKTGEVFSDENTEGLEAFRQKFNLDAFLSKEELLALGFEVAENE